MIFSHNAPEFYIMLKIELILEGVEILGLNELDPQPYWGFQDLFHKAGTKLNKAVYAIADWKREGRIEYFHYSKFLMLENFKLENFIEAIVRGYVLVDFDARTGHNHSTKFRLRQDKYPYLYGSVQELNLSTPSR